jgi:hypothetical protein
MEFGIFQSAHVRTQATAEAQRCAEHARPVHRTVRQREAQVPGADPASEFT